MVEHALIVYDSRRSVILRSKMTDAWERIKFKALILARLASLRMGISWPCVCSKAFEKEMRSRFVMRKRVEREAKNTAQ
jgi:hypothetical protein